MSMGKWVGMNPIKSFFLALAGIGTGVTLFREVMNPGVTKREQADFVKQMAGPPGTTTNVVAGHVVAGTMAPHAGGWLSRAWRGRPHLHR